MRHDYFFDDKTEHVFARLEPRKRRLPSVQGLLRGLAPEPDDLVVNVGAGDGRFSLAISRFMAEAGGRGVVFACDTSETKIKVLEEVVEEHGAGQHLYPVGLDPVEPYRLPFKDEQADCILSVDQVPWKLHPLPYLMEFARVLKPCGTLLLAQSNLQLTLDPPERVSRLPKFEERRPLLRHAGFDIFSSYDLSHYLWVERAMKPVVVFS